MNTCSQCQQEADLVSYRFGDWTFAALSRSPYTGDPISVCDACWKRLEQERERYLTMPDPFPVRCRMALLLLIRPFRALAWLPRCGFNYRSAWRCQGFADEMTTFPVLERFVTTRLSRIRRPE